MFLRSCDSRLAADENGLICAEILNQNTKHFGYLGSRTWPYKRGEPPQLQRDSWAVCSLFNIDLDRLRYSKLQSDGRSRFYKDTTRQTHIGIHKKLMVVTIFYIYECMCAGLPVAISVMDYDFVRIKMEKVWPYRCWY